MAWMKPIEALTKLPDLLIQRRSSFTFDGMPIVAERLPIRKRINLIRSGLDMIIRPDRSFGLPPIIQIEPTNICNLECPLCPTGSGALARPKGFMSIEMFQKILDELGEILVLVILYGWGEPFLNKEIPRMIKTCTDRNILTLMSTNGHYLQTMNDALRVVDAGLTTLIIAIDGSTQEIYNAYRKGGDVEKVKRCVTLIEKAKAQRRSQLPYTNLRLVVTDYNFKDLTNVERLACNLGVNMFSYKSVGSLTHSEKFRRYEPAEVGMRRYDYIGSSRRQGVLIQCPFPFRQPTIFWDGTVVGCEFDYGLQMPWGKIEEQSFKSIWNSSQAMKLRCFIRNGPDRPMFCSLCPYQDRVQDSNVLSCKELRSVTTEQ